MQDSRTPLARFLLWALSEQMLQLKKLTRPELFSTVDRVLGVNKNEA